jgi:hypothetical protein
MVRSCVLHGYIFKVLSYYQDPYLEGEEEGGRNANQLALLHQYDWTQLQLAVQKTNRAHRDLGEVSTWGRS